MVTGGGSVMPSVGGGQQGCVGGGGVVMATPGEGLPAQARRTGENRRSNKPIMEKRRRARINNCLNELKTLILDAMKKDPARHSKLEKADILEMTVKHLESLQRQQVAMSAATDPAVVNKFRAGFNECAGEVGRFPGLDSPVRRRLLQHLANCLNGAAPGPGPEQPAPGPEQPAPAPKAPPPQGIFFSTTLSAGGLQLVPTRLPNGDIALVLPSSGSAQLRPAVIASPTPSTSSNSSSPLPMLIPIPARTASTSSSASSCSSPVAFDRLVVRSPPAPSEPDPETEPETERPYTPPTPKPLSLVMRKRVEDVSSDDEQPWRPWH